MKSNKTPIANPFVMLREEFDDWAILFNPDTGRGFGLSPTGVYVWKLLDGEHSIDALLEEISGSADSVPGDAKEHIGVFVDALVAEGLAGYDDTGESSRENRPHTPLAEVDAVKLGTYEPPKLFDFTGGRAARGTTCSGHGSQGGYDCSNGGSATNACCTGTCGGTAYSCYPSGCNATYTDPCCTGTCIYPMCTGGSTDSGGCVTGASNSGGCACSGGFGNFSSSKC
jgi:SynChlorMet cassette protein ScmD